MVTLRQTRDDDRRVSVGLCPEQPELATPGGQQGHSVVAEASVARPADSKC